MNLDNIFKPEQHIWTYFKVIVFLTIKFVEFLLESSFFLLRSCQLTCDSVKRGEEV